MKNADKYKKLPKNKIINVKKNFLNIRAPFKFVDNRLKVFNLELFGDLQLCYIYL